jgi:hypothetical protein
MQIQLYLTLLAIIFAYVCLTDPNVLSWIEIQVKHLWVKVELQYIKLKWKFKKF